MNQNTKKTWFNWVGFVATWFAVILQFILMMQNRQVAIVETIIRFFSFFTILTNTLVALFFTAHVFNSEKSQTHFLNSKGAVTAITAFILVVGIVYQIILRGIWEPTGLQRLVDEVLHTFIPAFMFLYWFLFATWEDVKFKWFKLWIWYPVLYFVWVLVRGHFSGFYPYPFVDVPTIGYPQVFTNTLLIIIFLFILTTLLVVLGKTLNRKNRTHKPI